MNYIKRFLVLFLVLHLFSNAYSQEGNIIKMNLNECIYYAKEHNLSVKKAKLSYDQSLINTSQAKQSIYPDLSLGSSHSFSYYADNQSQVMDKGPILEAMD